MLIWNRAAALTMVFASILLPPLAAAAFRLQIVSGLVGGQDARSKELMALSPEEADRVARRDLLSVLRPAGKFTPDNGRNVTGMTFLTAPYLEDTFPTICRRDRVTLVYGEAAQYDREGKWARDERQPEGVEAQALFHVDQLPVPEKAWGQEPPRCDATHPDEGASWFAAPSLSDAMRAMNMLRMAEDQVRAGSLAPASCDGPTADCHQRVLSLDDPSKVVAVDPCPTAAPEDACYVLSFASHEELTIVATFPGWAMPTHIGPTAIKFIRVDDVVTISE